MKLLLKKYTYMIYGLVLFRIYKTIRQKHSGAAKQKGQQQRKIIGDMLSNTLLYDKLQYIWQLNGAIRVGICCLAGLCV